MLGIATGLAVWLAKRMWGRWLLTVAKGIAATFKWCLSDWRHAVIAVLAVVGAYFLLSASKWQGRTEKALAGLERANNTIADMKAASAKAKAVHDAKVAAINAENERKAERAKQDYQARLASNNAILRDWLRKTNRGASGRSVDPKTATTASGIVEASGTPVIPENYALVPVSDLELTAQAYATLEALQQWARDVGKVESQPAPLRDWGHK